MFDEYLVAHSELREARPQFEHLVLPQRKMAWVPLSGAGITQNVYGHRKLLLYRASPCLKQTTSFLHAIQWFTSFLGAVALRETSRP